MGKTKDKGLEALRDGQIVRNKLTEVIKVLLLQSQKRLENLEKSLEEALARAKTDVNMTVDNAEGTASAKTNEEIEEEIEKLKESLREERIKHWRIEGECEILDFRGADLTGSIREANTIFPDSKLPYVLREVTDRRSLLTRAMGDCNVLQDELQHIADTVYSDINKYTPLCLEIKTLFRKIRSIRQADNRFLPKDRESKD